MIRRVAGQDRSISWGALHACVCPRVRLFGTAFRGLGRGVLLFYHRFGVAEWARTAVRGVRTGVGALTYGVNVYTAPTVALADSGQVRAMRQLEIREFPGQSTFYVVLYGHFGGFDQGDLSFFKGM